MSAPPKCPACQRPLMSRVSKLCSFCGAKLPPELLFSANQALAIERSDAAARDLIRARAGLADASTKPTPLPTLHPERPVRAIRFERLSAFLSHIGYPLDHPNAARWKVAGRIDEGEWEVVMADCPNHFAIDWRTVLRDALPPMLERLAANGVALAAEFTPDGAEALLRRDAQAATVSYRPKQNELYDTALARVNTLLRGEFEFRGDEYLRGSDTDGYLFLSAAGWQRLERDFADFAPSFRRLRLG